MEEKDIHIRLNIAALIHKSRLGELSAEEESTLNAWIAEKESNAALYAELMSYDYVENYLENASSPGLGATMDNVYQAIGFSRQPAPVRSIHFMRTVWFRSAVAVFLLVAGAGTYFLLKPDAPAKPATEKAVAKITDIDAGKSGAVLTLADGSQVVLDSVRNGIVALQNGAKVLLDKDRLVYTGATGEGKVAYNTVTTPNGRQFHLVLQDGTSVWLNSASSISYPVAFTGRERHVVITGEAYLEVAKNKQMPFRVSVNKKAEINVLGTSFNINAYDNEGVIKATLLDGSIRTSVSSPDPGEPAASVVLKPGQQAQVTRTIKVNAKIDVNQVMAWKHGIFNFEGVELREMMRQLERWYDISVIYEKGVPQITFTGEMSRNIKLADLLIGLKGSGLNYRMAEGRKLILMP